MAKGVYKHCDKKHLHRYPGHFSVEINSNASF